MNRAHISAVVVLFAIAGSGCLDREGLTLAPDGGAAGKGGAGGAAGGAGNDGGGGATGKGGSSGGSGGCGPVCDIFCRWGNVGDASGCPTCKCNPAPACTPAECPPPPPYAQPICPDGRVTPPVCSRADDGTCGWTPPGCEKGCPGLGCAPKCPYGVAIDVNGCDTCQCNPPPACTAQDCGPAPGAPNFICPDGTIAGPSCGRGADGACGWTFVTCPQVCPAIACLRACPNGSRKDANGCETCDCLGAADCAVHADYATCQADALCTWLAPGCGTPALATQGCYARGDIGCQSDAGCSGGRLCLKRIVDPCFSPKAGPTCAACGLTQTVCL